MNWLDHVTAPVLPEELSAVGYVDGFQTQPGVWRHPGAQLPAIVPDDHFGVALRVDNVVAFAHAQESLTPPEGSARAEFRRAIVSAPGADVVIAGIEPRSWGRGINPQPFSDAESWRQQKPGLSGMNVHGQTPIMQPKQPLQWLKQLPLLKQW